MMHDQSNDPLGHLVNIKKYQTEIKTNPSTKINNDCVEGILKDWRRSGSGGGV